MKPLHFYNWIHSAVTLLFRRLHFANQDTRRKILVTKFAYRNIVSVRST